MTTGTYRSRQRKKDEEADRIRVLEQLIHNKQIIYGGGGGSHPRCQTRGPAPTAKKHVRDLDFTKK